MIREIFLTMQIVTLFIIVIYAVYRVENLCKDILKFSKPKQKLNIIQEPENPHMSVTLIVNKQQELTVIDNSVDDWRDFADCNTLIVKKVEYLQP